MKVRNLVFLKTVKVISKRKSVDYKEKKKVLVNFLFLIDFVKEARQKLIKMHNLCYSDKWKMYGKKEGVTIKNMISDRGIVCIFGQLDFEGFTVEEVSSY
jgi:uncharacterized membrane protein